VLFISGYSDIAIPIEADNPNLGFLSKPFQASALTTRVREMLVRPPRPSARSGRHDGSMGSTGSNGSKGSVREVRKLREVREHLAPGKGIDEPTEPSNP